MELPASLPMLPLTSGVVLPGMVLTLAVETDEAKAALAAAGTAEQRLVLVPRVDGRYASIGVVGTVVESGQLPGGPDAVVVSGGVRVGMGTGGPGAGECLRL